MGETDVYRRSSADCSIKPVPSVSQCHDRNTELSIHSGQQSGSVLLAAVCQELMNLTECLHGRNNAAFAGRYYVTYNALIFRSLFFVLDSSGAASHD